TAVLERSDATLANGACGSFGAWVPVTLVGGVDTTVVPGGCYRYRYSIADNVGNVSAPSTARATPKGGTPRPAVSVAAPTELSGAGAQYYEAGSQTQWFRPDASGSFTLNASASDAQSSVSSVAFPDASAVSGWTGSTGGSDATAPYASPTAYS